MTRYAEFPPRADLAPYVACLWVFESEEGGWTERIVPDGRCELIFHHGAPYLERGADGAFHAQPRVLFAGQLTRPLHLRAQGRSSVVGVRFHPAGAWPYIGAPLDSFTNARVAVTAAPRDAPTEAARLSAAQDHAAAEIARRALARDLIVERCVALIEAGASIDAVREAGGLSPRALQRRFAKIVGLSPQSLAAIFRLRRIFEALRDSAVETWTAAAQAAGYFDHPQMARDFRRFVGCSPSEFVASRPGLAAGIVDLHTN